MKKALALVLAGSVAVLFGGNPAAAAPGNTGSAIAGSQASPASDFGARKKIKRAQHRAHRHYRQSFGYDRGYMPPQGYYGGVQPGWGYGPDYGDTAWPPFHYRPFY